MCKIIAVFGWMTRISLHFFAEKRFTMYRGIDKGGSLQLGYQDLRVPLKHQKIPDIIHACGGFVWIFVSAYVFLDLLYIMKPSMAAKFVNSIITITMSVIGGISIPCWVGMKAVNPAVSPLETISETICVL